MSEPTEIGWYWATSLDGERRCPRHVIFSHAYNGLRVVDDMTNYSHLKNFRDWSPRIIDPGPGTPYYACGCPAHSMTVTANFCPKHNHLSPGKIVDGILVPEPTT